MANPDHVRRLKEGVESWNKWRGTDLLTVSLSGAELSGAELSGANLVLADLVGANLRGAELAAANLSIADLAGADIAGADLTGAKLNATNLPGADLTRANLTSAHLHGAVLSTADLTTTTMWSTVLSHLDLRDVKGLEHIRHAGRSSLGIDTIYKSNGEIPDVFLRGCGVPEDMIGYIHSIRGAIQFYSCFISYSTKNQDFAERLHNDLQAKGVRCWFAPHDVQGGRKLHEQIDEAIRLHDKLLLILSPDSMNSEWVKTEIAKARKREVRDLARVLFPVRLCSFTALRDWECFDADAGKDSAREIREYYIPDFSDWKTDADSYTREFEKLLRDLQPATGAVASAL